MIRSAVPLLALLALAACESAPSGAPSLLPRPAEAQSFDEPAAAPVATAAPDPALDARIATLAAQRDTAVAEFAAADRKVARIIASGARAAPGSDAWLDAQTAIGALDAERATVLGIQTDLEQLAIARATEGLPPYPALSEAQAATQAELDRINATLAQRKVALPL